MAILSRERIPILVKKANVITAAVYLKQSEENIKQLVN